MIRSGWTKNGSKIKTFFNFDSTYIKPMVLYGYKRNERRIKMINIKFKLEDSKELRLVAKLIDQCEKEIHNDIQEVVNNSIRFLKEDYQFVFSFQYGEFEELTITKKGE